MSDFPDGPENRHRIRTMSDTTKPPAINRKDDPAWAMFAAAAIARYSVVNYTYNETIRNCADFADAMIRERDRRDREERP